MAQAEGEQPQVAVAPANNMVGPWGVVYTAGGKVFNETLDQWYIDGTEFENAFLAPGRGNICFRVWKAVSLRTVRLHHIGWTFDPASTGTANGTFRLDETNTVALDGRTYRLRATPQREHILTRLPTGDIKVDRRAGCNLFPIMPKVPGARRHKS